MAFPKAAIVEADSPPSVTEQGRAKSPSSPIASESELPVGHADMIPGILPASHWVEQAKVKDEGGQVGYSAHASLAQSSTTSLAESITEYRNLLGRTYHHQIGNAEGWNPNDETHKEALDL